MKRIKYLLFILLLIIPFNIKAATINCSAPSSVESGETFSVTFSGSLSSAASLWLASVGSEGNASYSSGNLNIVAESASMSHTVTFLAGDPGTARFYLYDVDVSDGNKTYNDSSTCTVTIVEATSSNGSSNGSSSLHYDDSEDSTETKSSNNYLKSLSIDGVKLSPTFNKDTLEYTSIVSGDVEKINIKAEVEDDKSTVDGIGERELKGGINKIEVKVTAEDGSVITYTLTITRKEKNPIEVTINKKKYTVIKKDIGLTPPDGFVKTSIVINNEEVESYSNSFTGYILVALVDENGNASWYIYNSKNGTYTKYSEFKSDGVRLIILKASKKDVPYKYKKCKIEINGEIVDGYALEYNSPFRLVYALNMNTGEKGFYLYDMDENTFQRFYNIQVNIYRNLLKKLEIGIICLLSIITIMSIVIVSLGVINKKTKKFIKNGGKKEKEDIIVDEEEEEEKKEELKKKVKEKSDKIKKDKKEKEQVKTNKFDKSKKETKDIDKPLTREEIRKRKKEEKEELAKARRDFFE